MKRVETNDAASMFLLGNFYQHGSEGLQQDHAKAMDLYTKAADLGNNNARYSLADVYEGEGELKKAKFHFEAAAIAGDEASRCNLGNVEVKSGNIERAIKHWSIGASAGNYCHASFEIMF
jgi:TPR repeat protein